MFRDLLVPLIDAPSDAAALRAAVALARSFDARLAALAVVPLYQPPAFEWGAMPSGLYAALQAQTREHGEALAAKTRADLARAEVPVDVRVVETQVVPFSRVAALHARHADLVVMAAPEDDVGRRNAEALFLDLLLDAGRPVLRIPASCDAAAFPPQRVTVAWQPTREAARAVHDALPLLRVAKRVDIVCVDPRIDEHRHGDLPGADIAEHLARHRCRVEVTVLQSHGEPAAEALLRVAASFGSDLVVAGGFGHSRVRERWLGGFTRTLCEQNRVAALFSH
jgi:nucleotide-binding universal stress UspA family protein